ncbi:hypothetical protein TNCV_2189521 [Trichonephila clavipes]|nr:hypothetical protein TNCV_2189521 [Trichonephila clavipes]
MKRPEIGGLGEVTSTPETDRSNKCSCQTVCPAGTACVRITPSQSHRATVQKTAFGDEAHNYKLWLNDEHDTRAGTSFSKLPHSTNIRTFSLDSFSLHKPLYMAGL